MSSRLDAKLLHHLPQGLQSIPGERSLWRQLLPY